MLLISVLLKNCEEQSFGGLSELGGDGNTSSDRAGLLLRIRATPVSLPRSSGRVLRRLSIGPAECPDRPEDDASSSSQSALCRTWAHYLCPNVTSVRGNRQYRPPSAWYGACTCGYEIAKRKL